MRTCLTASAMLAALVALPADALAQQSGAVPPNQRYCLEETSSGPHGGGTSPLLCRFTTLEQCNASKSSPADRCLLNPALGPEKN